VDTSGMQQPAGYELVRRNREIAQVRDVLQQRDRELEQWKTRHGDLLARTHELDGELSRQRSRVRCLQELLDKSAEAAALAMKEERDRHSREVKEVARAALDPGRGPQVADAADSLAKSLQHEVESLRAMLGASEAALELRLHERMAAVRSEFDQEIASRVPREEVLMMEAQLRELRAETIRLRQEASRAVDLERKLASFVPQADHLRMEAQVMAMCAENIGLRDEVVTLQAALDSKCEEGACAADCAEECESELERQLAESVPRVEMDRAEAQVLKLKSENVRLEKEAQRVAELERQLSMCVPCEEVLQRETQVQLLQAENADFCNEIDSLKLGRKELREQVEMVTEEARGRKAEATMEIGRLRNQLDVSRRARSTEMHALIAKMRKPGTSVHADMPSAA